jgi:metal-responsive CopG/Arc/MetJ family transcriptional regulator
MVSENLGKSKRINIIINESLNQQLSQAAERSGITKSAFVRVALEREFVRDRNLELECAAYDLAYLYDPDQELTVFSALDGEDFLLFDKRVKKIS